LFCRAVGQSVQGSMLVYPRGGCGNTICHLFADPLVCRMSPKQVWSQHLMVQEPSCFLGVMWHREALYMLGIQDVKALILLGAFFLPSVAPVSQQSFWFMELSLSASALGIFKIRCHELFAHNGLKPQSSWLLSPK
jgi:hypothetical protein